MRPGEVRDEASDRSWASTAVEYENGPATSLLVHAHADTVIQHVYIRNLNHRVVGWTWWMTRKRSVGF